MGAGHTHALYVHGHSRVHAMAPESKVVAAVGLVLVAAFTPVDAPWAFVVDGLLLALVIWAARLSPRFVLSRATVVLPFIFFLVVVPFVARGEQVTVLGMSLSVEGLRGARTILGKALIGVTVSVVLAATTETTAIMRGLERLRVPPVLTAIATFMLRYLQTIADELGRMRTAMTARGYDPRWLWQTKPIAQSAGALFVRSYERGERVHSAMLSRGFSGSMPVTDSRVARTSDWAWALALPLTALLAMLGIVAAGL